MRLIDADELIKDIMSYKTMPEIRKAICEVIDDAPTVEPEKVVVANFTFDKDELDQIVRDRVIEPIKNGELVIKEERPHGEWARHDAWRNGEYIGGFYHVDCPCIDTETALYSKWETRFCPNCGAEMREDSDK